MNTIPGGCEVCGQDGATMHEIWYGNGIRKISIKNKLQIALCPVCHEAAHCRPRAGVELPDVFNTRKKQEIQKRLCEVKGIDYDKTDYAIRKHQYIAKYKDLGNMTPREFLYKQSLTL